MELGISSWTYAWAVGVPGHEPPRPLGVLDLVERAVELDVGVLQIADNLPLHELPENQLEALATAARRHGVLIEVGARGIGEEHLDAYVQLAKDLGSRILRVVVDTDDQRPSEDEIVETVGALVPALQQAGVTLAIENHDRFTAHALAGLVSRMDSDWVGVCLDSANSFGALDGPDVVVDVLGPLAVNVHVKDFVVHRPNHKMGFVIEGRPAGQGQLDIERFLAGVAVHGRDPNVILEQWTAPEGALPATIAKEARGAEQGIAHLKAVLAEL